MSEAKIQSALLRRHKNEAPLERRCVNYAKTKGLVSRKMNGLGFRDWPDRLFLPKNMSAPWVKPWHCIWVEFKKFGVTPTPAQARFHDELRCRGQLVYVVDNYERFREIIDDYLVS